jgi:hypothetical protein
MYRNKPEHVPNMLTISLKSVAEDIAAQLFADTGVAHEVRMEHIDGDMLAHVEPGKAMIESALIA